jgi:hypothetical protein
MTWPRWLFNKSVYLPCHCCYTPPLLQTQHGSIANINHVLAGIQFEVCATCCSKYSIIMMVRIGNQIEIIRRNLVNGEIEWRLNLPNAADYGAFKQSPDGRFVRFLCFSQLCIIEIDCNSQQYAPATWPLQDPDADWGSPVAFVGDYIIYNTRMDHQRVVHCRCRQIYNGQLRLQFVSPSLTTPFIFTRYIY